MSVFIEPPHYAFDTSRIEIIEVPTSNENLSLDKNIPIKIYPNPSQEIVMVELPNEFHKNQNYEIELINSLGKSLNNISLHNFNINKIRIEMKNNPNGLYWIIIRNNQKKIISKPFIKIGQ